MLRDPAGFAWRTLRAFRANQGLLLAGAVAHCALLSIVPLLILIILSLGVGMLLVTLVSGGLTTIEQERVELLGRSWSLHGVSGARLYLLGFAGEVFVLTSVYLVMPYGRLRLAHALTGGVTAAVLREITRHMLVWCFATLSQVNVVYGSLKIAIVVRLSLEIAATLLLFGAQVITEYERLVREPKAA